MIDTTQNIDNSMASKRRLDEDDGTETLRKLAKVETSHSNLSFPIRNIGLLYRSTRDGEVTAGHTVVGDYEQKAALKLDTMPQEILVLILAEVPFSPEMYLKLALVCRRFHDTIGLKSKDSGNMVNRRVIERQYDLINAAVGLHLNPTWDHVNRLRHLQNQIHDIICIIKANMNVEDALNESECWEDQFFNCLLLYVANHREKLLLDHCRNQSPLDDLHITYVTAIRYVCVKLAQCLQNFARVFTVVLRDTAGLPYAFEALGFKEIDTVTNSLEFLMLSRDWDAELMVTSLLEILISLPAGSRQPGLVWQDLATYNHFFSQLLTSPFRYDAIVFGPPWLLSQVCSQPLLSNLYQPDEKTSGFHVVRDSVRALTKQLACNEKINVLEFMQRHIEIGVQDENAREVLRSGIDPALSCLTRAYKLLVAATKHFKWESVIRAQLLNGSSKLRRNFKPSASFLEQIIQRRDFGNDVADD